MSDPAEAAVHEAIASSWAMGHGVSQTRKRVRQLTGRPVERDTVLRVFAALSVQYS